MDSVCWKKGTVPVNKTGTDSLHSAYAATHGDVRRQLLVSFLPVAKISGQQLKFIDHHLDRWMGGPVIENDASIFDFETRDLQGKGVTQNIPPFAHRSFLFIGTRPLRFREDLIAPSCKAGACNGASGGFAAIMSIEGIRGGRRGSWRGLRSRFGGRSFFGLVFRSGIRGHSVLGLASQLIAQAGPIAELATWHPEDFRRIKGIGAAKGRQLAAIIEIGRRMVKPPTGQAPLLDRPHLIAEHMAPFTRGGRKVLDFSS